MQLAFYKGRYGNLWDKIICLVTRSEYSHVELVYPNNLSWSSSPRDGGVRQTYIIPNDHWTLVPIPNISEKLFLQENGKAYDYIGLLGTVFYTPIFSSNAKWFCSEIIAEALGLPESWSYTPQMLYEHYN